MTLHEDSLATLRGWMPPGGRQQRLRDEYVDHLAANEDGLSRGCHPAHVTAGALVLSADHGSVLLTLHAKAHRWFHLGGHCEQQDTTLAGAALREATEESGLAGLRLLPDLIDVDVHAVRCAGGDGAPAGPSHHFDVRFVATCPPGAVERVSAESAALGWFAPDALPEPLAAGVAQQIAPALARLQAHR